MLKFEWNALRVGDPVQVHDDRTTALTLTAGTVVMIESNGGKRRTNGVGIRVRDTSGTNTVWPSYLAVHRDGFEDDDGCWRCAAATPDR